MSCGASRARPLLEVSAETTGGRDPGVYCCAEHTLAARRVRETDRKLKARAKEKGAKKIKVISKHKR